MILPSQRHLWWIWSIQLLSLWSPYSGSSTEPRAPSENARRPHILPQVKVRHLQKEFRTRQSKHCGFSIYIFDNSKSKSMVRLVRAEKMVLSGLVFARKIARMILIQNIQGLMGPLMIKMALSPLYMWEMWGVTPVTDTRTNRWKVVQYSVWAESAILKEREIKTQTWGKGKLVMRRRRTSMRKRKWSPPSLNWRTASSPPRRGRPPSLHYAA